MEVFIVPLGFFAMLAFGLHVIVSGIVRSRLMTRQSQLLMRLVDKVPPDVAPGFLDSPLGQSLLEGADRRTLVLTRVIAATQSFVVLTVVGLAILLFQGRAANEEGRTALVAMGSLSVLTGVAFLVAGVAAWFMSRRWGLLDRTRIADVETPADTSTAARDPIYR